MHAHSCVFYVGSGQANGTKDQKLKRNQNHVAVMIRYLQNEKDVPSKANGTSYPMTVNGTRHHLRVSGTFDLRMLRNRTAHQRVIARQRRLWLVDVVWQRLLKLLLA